MLALLLPLLLAGVAPPGSAFFTAHRQKLVEKLPADAVAVFRSAPETSVETSPDPYRQDSTFWYLTGFEEPDALAVLRPGAPAGKRYLLFVPEKDFPAEQWTGWRAGTEGAKKDFGADEAYPIGELATRLPGLLVGARSLYYGDGGDAKFKDQLVAAWSPADPNAREPRPMADAGPIVNQMRLVKDETEIALLRRAAQLSAEAHVAALRALKPGAYEYALKAEMVRSCFAGGATRMAYPPIVGSGRNSVVLHY